MRKVVKVVAWIIGVFILLLSAGAAYLRFAKPDVGKAPNLKIVATPERIERGRYLAHHVAGCIDCHSTRDLNRFSTPMIDGTDGKGGEQYTKEMGFPGNFYTRNITPFALKSWTDGEIFRAITCGVTKDGEPLFPVMPYGYYGKADTEDLYSIIAYIRTLPAIANVVPKSKPEFPFSLIERTIPSKAAPAQRPAADDSVGTGKYLVNFAGCVECHTQVDDKSQLITGTEFGGGREFTLWNGTVVRSVNITPHPSGIGSWDRTMFIACFKKYAQSGAAMPLSKEDNNTVMPWTALAGMTEADLSCIYQYLQTLKPIDNQVIRFPKKVK